MAQVTGSFTIESLRKLTLEDQEKMLRGFATLASDEKKAKDECESAAPTAGKLLYVFEERMQKAIAAEATASNASLKDYVKQYVGKDANVSNRAYSCKNAFALVKAGLIDELDYDYNGATPLGVTSSIITEANKDLTHPAVLEAATLLKVRPKNHTSLLKAILAGLKGPKKIDIDKAKEMAHALFEQGYFVTVLSIADRYAATQGSAEQRSICFSVTADVIEKLGSIDERRQWTQERIEAKARSAKQEAEKATPSLQAAAA